MELSIKKLELNLVNTADVNVDDSSPIRPDYFMCFTTVATFKMTSWISVTLGFLNLSIAPLRTLFKLCAKQLKRVLFSNALIKLDP